MRRDVRRGWTGSEYKFSRRYGVGVCTTIVDGRLLRELSLDGTGSLSGTVPDCIVRSGAGGSMIYQLDRLRADRERAIDVRGRPLRSM